MIDKSCEICKVVFRVPNVRQKFCSRKCLFISRKGKASPMKGKKHSSETRARISQSLMGNKNFPLNFQLKCKLCEKDFDCRNATGKWCETCSPERSFDSRIRLYGVSKPIWDRMLSDQDGKCTLCDNEPDVVDHDHKTGKTRGLLCYGCNSALGRFEVIGWADKAREYTSRSFV